MITTKKERIAMGMYDSVMVSCPHCGAKNEFQSKSGNCELCVYELNDCPEDVLYDINRHSPVMCSECRTLYRVDERTRDVVEISPSDVFSYKMVDIVEPVPIVTEPYKCPICRGTGNVPNGFYNSVSGQWSSTDAAPEKCRSCDGTGIIWGVHK